jgi:homocysteine S-methyltransferase
VKTSTDSCVTDMNDLLARSGDVTIRRLPRARYRPTMFDLDRVTVLDGGLATELEARHHDLSGSLWSARMLRDEPAEIEEVHLSFFRAGAQVAITASYQASFDGFAREGIDGIRAAALMRRSLELAERARARRLAELPPGVGAELHVAASIGPYGAARADGSEYRGNYGVTRDELASFHAPRLAELVDDGAELFAVETLPSVEEAVVVRDLLAAHPSVRAWVSFSCRDAATISDGTPIEDAVAEAVASPQVIAVGVNCLEPSLVEPLLARAAGVTTRPLVAYPNDGRVWDAGARRWSGTSSAFGPDALTRWRDLGARLIGGCCGVRPAAIERIAATLAA